MIEELTFEEYAARQEPEKQKELLGFKQLAELARENDREYYDMIRRARGGKTKHRHRWQKIGSFGPVKSRKRVRVSECMICGATKARFGNQTRITPL